MPVDKFGHTDSTSTQRVVAGGVTLTQVNNTFARIDGSNAFVGNLNMGGNSIKGLPTDYPGDHACDEAVSFSQGTALVADKITNSAAPTADNHFTNKKYVDELLASKVSKSGNTMSGNLYLSVDGANTREMRSRLLRVTRDSRFVNLISLKNQRPRERLVLSCHLVIFLDSARITIKWYTD